MGDNILIDLKKNCRSCHIGLTSENAAKKNAKYYRNECKSCRSNNVQKLYTGNPKRNAYMQNYLRKKGIVKEYPCETCNILCYKKYARAFCSDKCRFMAYVQKQDECWLWIGSKNKKGYGQFCFNKYKNATASRVAYELFKGPIDKGKFICHTCDIPSCVNPDHLWIGTHIENMMDMVEKGRQNSKLTPTDVFEIRNLWAKGYSNQKLMEMFQLTSGTVSNIIARRIWNHV